MQSVILDTNVVVSALIGNSIPTRIVNEYILTKAVQLCLSQQVYEEFVEVLARDKFSKIPNFAAKSSIVLKKLADIAEFYEPSNRLAILPDADDDMFLDLAMASAADILITGNTQDFPMQQFEQTRIATPREYWDLYRP